MRKTLIILSSALLILFVMIACTQDTDGIFKAIINTSATSAYKCSSYIGENSGKHYVLTNNKGIIFFGIEENKALDVKTLDTGNYKAIRGAYIESGYLYGLDVSGVVFKVNLDPTSEEEITTLNGNYAFLADGYVVTSKPDEKMLMKINGDPVASATDIRYPISKKYFIGPTAIYNNGEVFCAITGQKIVCIVDDQYAVIKVGSLYSIHKIEGKEIISDKTLGFLSGEPTAAFSHEDYIYFKTTNGIDEFNTTESDNDKAVTSKTDGWAKNICTNTTEITEFVKIGNSIYSVNESGGMLFINFDESKTEPVFSE